jgi:methionyl-tRNA synthetase
LPFTSAKLKKILHIESNTLLWSDVEDKEELLSPNHQIGKGELLFAKIEDSEIEAQLAKLEATKLENIAEYKVAEPQKETIEFDDFTKLDMRVGTIIEAFKVPKTKKLLQLKVDVGIDVRTIVSGIAESFNPEDIVGQKVTVLVNLAPRILKGVESMGMILMCNTPDGKLAFIEPENDSVANGEQIS